MQFAQVRLVLLTVGPNYKSHQIKFDRMTKAMEMKSNEAYGPVSSSQPPPPPASQGAYDFCQ